jgi:glycosyltransferase 2 family protein
MRPLPSSPFGRIWLTLLGIGISVAALWIAIRNVDLATVGQRLADADARYLLLALVAASAQVYLRTVRWQLLLPMRPDGRRVAARRILPVLLIGYLGNVALPARLGEVARTYLLSRREGLDSVAVFGTVVLERILDVAALAVFAITVAWSIGAPPWILGAAGLAAAVGLVALVVAIAGFPRAVRAMSDRLESSAGATSPRRLPGAAAIVRLARRFSGGVGGSHSRRAVATAATLSFLAWPFDALLVWLVAASIDVDISPGAAALISAAAVLSTAVPSAPGYLGTYELAAASAAQAMGVASSAAFALAVLAHAFTILPVAIAGGVSLVLLRDSFAQALPGADEDAPLPASGDLPLD